jgi:hypothetical protein
LELQLEQGLEQGPEQEQERERERGRGREREQHVEGGLRHAAVVVVKEEGAGVAFANLYMSEVERPAHTVPERTRGEEEGGEVRHRLTWVGYQCRANLCMAN